MENVHKIAVIEALLFVREEPLKLKEIASILDVSVEEASVLMAELDRDFHSAHRGLQVVNIDGGYQLGTKPDVAPFLEKMFYKETLGNLTIAALEALAIIAYKQPVTRLEIEAIRGVNSDGVLDNLARRRLIEVSGRKDTPGKPMLYSTTPEFLKYFGLKNLDELPPLRKEGH
ncbi:MAG: SMC-Scp complex subunit ScpB [Firmicutes bacterium]|jgi:segregation and condensation protein B|nr:SMC-Scp complex subunit ScpB [Bacillota bacterium]